jgi:hypothetical protein
LADQLTDPVAQQVMLGMRTTTTDLLIERNAAQ